MGGGGSSSSQPTEQKVTQTQFPEEAKPYFTRLLKRTEAESLQPYSQYGGQRLAYFSPDELNAQAMTRGFAGAGSPREFDIAAQKASMAGMPLYSGYGAGLTGSGYNAANLQPGYGAGLINSGYGAGMINSGYGAGQIGSGYRGERVYSGYNPSTRGSQYQAGYAGPQYQGMGYEQNINRFMSPYQQNVIDMQKREASRQSGMLGDQTADAATQAGGLGGYREAIMQSERERNLAQQLGDIQAQGSQAGFESAQQQLERERAAGLSGSQFGLTQFQAQEQVRQQQEQLAQAGFGQSEQARQQAAAMGMTAQQQTAAAMQEQERYRQSAFGQSEQARQEQERYRQAAFGQTEQGRQEQERFRQAAFGQTEQGRQQQEQLRLQAFQYGESAKQEAAKLGLNAAQQNEAARQAQEKFRQSSYDLTNRYALQSSQQLQGIGQARTADAMQRMNALQSQGSQMRALRQAGLDVGYEDFLRQEAYPQQRLGMFSNLIQGLPLSPNQTISTYQQQPGLFQQAVGLGLSGLGMYKGMGG